MKKSPQKTAAFTIIEILTATAVLLLLVTIVFQVVSETARSSGAGNSRMEATRSARTALDTLAQDLSSAAVDYHGQGLLVEKDADGNTTLAFPCLARGEKGSIGTPRMGAVFYKVRKRDDQNSSTSVPMLCRGFASVPWENVSTVNTLSDKLQSAFSSGVTGVDSDQVSVDPLSETIFRMEAVFVNADGDVVFEPPIIAGSGGLLDLAEIRAVIVAVAAVDKKTLLLLQSQNSDGMTALSRALPKVTEDGVTPQELWSKADLTAFPKAAQNVRFFQRIFYVQ
jgi:type II secretory pathway pseudopilin PulG